MTKKSFLYTWLHGADRHIERNGYVWNSVQGIVNAAQSVVILIIIMRVCGPLDGGIFTISFSIANMMLYIGKYGTRNYQVTDYTEKYSFSEYVVNRLLTTLIMVLVSVIYCFVSGWKNHYEPVKTGIMLMWCIVKVVDSLTDVLEGSLQQRGRIDIAARLYVIRTTIAIGVTLVVLAISKDLFLATLTALIGEFLLAIFLNWAIRDDYKGFSLRVSLQPVCALLVVCFPLFVYGFCNLFMTNAPKMAIDTVLGDSEQAMYGIIAMPVFVVNLLAQFVYNPILRTLGIHYHNQEYREISKKINMIVWVILGLTLVCVLGALILGVPVFNWMYRTDISDYKVSMLILIAGGGAQALCTLFMSSLTVIRFQKVIIWVYAVFGAISAVIFTPVVRSFGVQGSCICYGILTFLVAVSLGILYGGKLRHMIKTQECNS